MFDPVFSLVYFSGQKYILILKTPCDAQQSDNNIAFPPQFPPFNVVLLFELPVENRKHPNFEWRGGEGI